MKTEERDHEVTQDEMIKVRVEAEEVTRLNIGSCWEVVAAAPDSLWERTHTVTLKKTMSR